jgi:hypothetical protein
LMQKVIKIWNGIINPAAAPIPGVVPA